MAGTADYFAALSTTDLMRVVVALATEVYALTDRVRALESVLARSGVDLRALDAPAQPAAFDGVRRAERDAFVQRVFAALEQPGSPPRPGAKRRAASAKPVVGSGSRSAKRAGRTRSKR